MPVRRAEAEWKGNLAGGAGTIRSGSGAIEEGYSYGSRFEEGAGTNPEELIAAAHAGCFAMALSHGLSEADYEPESVRATAEVKLEKQEGDFAMTQINLRCEAEVPEIDEDTFQQHAREAKENCPVSKALRAVEITLDATLAG